MPSPTPLPAQPPAAQEQLLSALSRSPLLSGLSPDELAVFARHLELHSYAAGACVMREGENGHAMYFVLSGEADLVRKHLELKPLKAGDSFGEMGLVAERPRAATITASTALELAVLPRAGWHALHHDDPQLARRFLQALVSSLGEELVAMTDRVGSLLSERSLPRRTQLEIRLGDGTLAVPTGTRVRGLLPDHVGDSPVVAALLDRKSVSLETRLFSDHLVEPLTTRDMEGRKIYRNSAALLLLEAAHTCAPELNLRIGRSLGGAAVVQVAGAHEPASLAARVNRAIRALVDADVPFRHEVWTVEEARAHFTEAGWDDAARGLRTARTATAPMVSCGALYAPSPGPLLPSTGCLRDACVTESEGDGLLLEFGDPIRRHLPAPEGELAAALDRDLPAPRTGGDMVKEHRGWLDAMKLTSVGAFNEQCIAGQLAQIIRISEGFHEKRIGRLADAIQRRRPELRIICIAGPSSSGKTTFIKRLSVQLQVNGMNPVSLSLDDYYVDRERTVKDEKGEYDFEAFEAIDYRLLQKHLSRLMAGETVRTARYDFKEGRSLAEGGRELRLGSDDVLMMEGIHGLNPRLLEGVGGEDEIFRVFIHPATTLRLDPLAEVNTADLRLLRRIVRDRHGRGYEAAESIRRWPSVRRGERLHIFPFLPNADAVFDSALVYEMSVLRVFADRYLLEVPQGHPSFATAYRLRNLLDRFVPLYPDHVPPTSILREFIGGSGFEY